MVIKEMLSEDTEKDLVKKSKPEVLFGSERNMDFDKALQTKEEEDEEPGR